MPDGSKLRQLVHGLIQISRRCIFTICQRKNAFYDKMSRPFVNRSGDIISNRSFVQRECELAHTHSRRLVENESTIIAGSKVTGDQANERVLMNLRQKLDRQIDHAPRDLPSATLRSLRLSVTALVNAYDEDDDPHKIEPDDRSFHRLMEYLSHPYHHDWPPPAIAVTQDGLFSAIWQDPGVHRWILNFATNGGISEIYLHTNPDGNISHHTRTSRVTEYSPPFFQIEKLPH
jgi:hypothetical protein